MLDISHTLCLCFGLQYSGFSLECVCSEQLLVLLVLLCTANLITWHIIIYELNKTFIMPTTVYMHMAT